MISYDEISKEANNPELDSVEKDLLDQLEQITDHHIRDQFPSRDVVSISLKMVDAITSKVRNKRSNIIKDLWKKLYIEGGWSIEYDSEDYIYDLTKKK